MSEWMSFILTSAIGILAILFADPIGSFFSATFGNDPGAMLIVFLSATFGIMAISTLVSLGFSSRKKG